MNKNLYFWSNEFTNFQINTVDPVYSELGYSEYPLIVNGFLRTDR
jgi:hypothetical protein